LNNTQTITGCLDRQGDILIFEDQAALSGYLSHEVIGKNWFDIFIPVQDRKEIRQVFSSLLEGLEPHWTYDNCIIDKEGQELFLHFENNLIQNQQGNIIGISFTASPADYAFLGVEHLRCPVYR
jgi:PAS domain S-box-containing protein